jgi:hypothetical protein
VISGLLRFVIFRLFGARVLIILEVLGWLRNRFGPKSATSSDRDTGSTTRRAG